MNCLPPLLINLAGMLVIYCLMTLALVRLYWHGRGIVPVLATIIIAGFFWSGPTFLTPNVKIAGVVSYSLWLGNLLVSGFAVVLLCQAVRSIPRQLEDSARLDGSGWFGTVCHVVLPFVRLELGLMALLTLLGTSVLCWGALSMPGGPYAFCPPWFNWLSATNLMGESTPSLAKFFGEMIAGSLVTTLPVILIFFLAKRYLQHPPVTEVDA
ncbi:MAG: multiple sugar transport system permease protein [Verrucomicrobiota bacterium]|jgi:ABC-type glycerol-3-phosphate transport system permease component